MKIGYTAINKVNKEKVEFFAHSTETANKLGTLDAQNWITNHLDVSYEWNYAPNGKFRHESFKPQSVAI